MLYKKNYFSSLVRNLTQRSERAALGLLGIGNAPLRQFLHDRLTSAPGTEGALLADPVFEPTFGWQESQETMSSLAGGPFLNRKLAQVMAAPPKELAEEYAFPSDRHPFEHQLSAWEVLNHPKPQSLVVTSGTGSGKTECFLVPVLNQLANEVDATVDPEGIRALFIYPLNALINSQQSRLDAWTDGFDGKIRHCLYTGALENERKASDQKYKGQVIDRTRLRDSPPQILVTNATMLEYMLIRKEDAPLLQKSEGKLRWIILDEAHSYIGSQAAEMALLLRRVMLAFKVKPEDVRFVATSATFGSDEQTIENLRSFLADIGGISVDQVHVVQGRREIPALPVLAATKVDDFPQGIADIDPDHEVSAQRYLRLAASPIAVSLRGAFVPGGETRPKTLTALQEISGLPLSVLLAWLDLMTGTKNAEGLAFLPLRGHLFHGVIPIIRACIDKNCKLKPGTALGNQDWPFGMVYTDDRTHCDCKAPLMPLVKCEECTELFLQGYQSERDRLVDHSFNQDDEFSMNSEPMDAEGEDDVEADDGGEAMRTPVLITNRPGEDCYTEHLDRASQKFINTPTEDCIEVTLFRSLVNECPCCTHQSKTRSIMRAHRIGAPFTLGTVIGTLLEYCPEDKTPQGKPFQGRKLISFTDSRQGTARIAVKLQQDSERNRIRGLVYHHLISSQSVNTLTSAQQVSLAVLEAKADRDPMEKMLFDMLVALRDNAGPAEISWTAMVSQLSSIPEVEIGILDYYRGLAPHVFGPHDSVALAGMLMAREFYRRPKRANSLETMGLVQVTYSKLAQVTSTPLAWPSGKGVDSWRSYLKVIMDFYVRENTILNIDKRWQSLIGAKIQPKWLLPSGTNDKPGRRFVRWPSVNKGSSVQSRLILMLCKAFGWSVQTHDQEIDSILQDAWQVLTQQVRLLTNKADGYQLDLADLSFRLPKTVYFCTVSRRFIDTPFEGLSPYTPRNDRNHVAIVKPYTLPVPAQSLIDMRGDEGLLAIRDWSENEPGIVQLRQQGLWSDVADLVVEGGHYFRSAEHSAQQPKKKLDRYETDFKLGKLNLLSCSTTMEMGVDIGGITVVAMNNVPPHPANYLQRAGRAGRRREGRALAVTVCKNTPHDQAVFRNPLWPFNTGMRMPKVSLQSPALIQRHVNSWLLSHWLKNIAGALEIKSMTVGAFFLNGDLPVSLAERFCAWVEGESYGACAAVTEAVASITRRSVLSSMPVSGLLNDALRTLREIQQKWVGEHSISKSQLDGIGNKTAAAYRAMSAQLARVEKEYLLSELAGRRFLPGYGFPTDIVSFDNQCMQNFRSNEGGAGREDNRGRYRDLASRDRITGLREYGPGAELVMDGLVYKSGGITLNWHAPASEENVKELQLIKKAWKCGACGASGTGLNPGLNLNCPECGADVDKGNIREYLVPSGFAVDFFAEPHTDIESLAYVPVKKPLLNVPASWIALSNPALGQFRSSHEAHLFHYTSGVGGNGFAICLECGRAEPMLEVDDSSDSTAANEQRLAHTFRSGQTHRRLRGGKNDSGENVCPGSYNSWKIKQAIHLGNDSITDALELILFNPDSGEPLKDVDTGYSIAIALRDAIAEQLCVQPDELGCDCENIQINGHWASAIRVFDQRSGGYATQAVGLLNERGLWKRVIDRLDCDCSHACQCCLLSFDTRFEADRLDRHEALKWINKDWLVKLDLPAELKVFGVDTRPEIVTLYGAIERELAADNLPKTLSIYLPAPAAEWDLATARKLRHGLLAWEGAGHQIALRLTESTFNELPSDQKEWLHRLAVNNIKIEVEQSLLDVGLLTLNTVLSSQKQHIAWASNDEGLLVPNKDWNPVAAGSCIVYGLLSVLPQARQITAQDLNQASASVPGIVKVELGSELDGSLSGFAKRFWDAVEPEAGQLDFALSGQDPIETVSYSDRYVCNPFTACVLVNILYELKQRSGEEFSVKILGRKYLRESSRTSWKCWHDWLSSEDRDRAILQAIEYCGLTGEVLSQPVLAHYRQLRIGLASGRSLTIQFDQGLSFWEATRSENGYSTRFNFEIGNMGAELMEKIQTPIRAAASEGTQLFLSSDK